MSVGALLTVQAFVVIRTVTLSYKFAECHVINEGSLLHSAGKFKMLHFNTEALWYTGKAEGNFP